MLSDLGVEAATIFRLQELGVTQPTGRPVGRKNDGSCCDWSGQAAPADLVDAGHVTEAAYPEGALLGEVGVKAGPMPGRNVQTAADRSRSRNGRTSPRPRGQTGVPDGGGATGTWHVAHA